MNKILKATFSYYQSQRDIILSELDILLNQNSSSGSTQKTIDLIKELTMVNLCLNTIEIIIKDNQSDQKLTDLKDIADILNEKLINKNENK